MNCLERQFVCCVWCSKWNCIDGGCLCDGSGLGGSRSGLCLGSCSRCRSCLTAIYAECTDVVEPAAVVLVCIDVEVNRQLFAYLNIEGGKTVNAKDVEHHLAGVLTRNFQYKRLGLPFVARSATYSAALVELGYNFTC